MPHSTNPRVRLDYLGFTRGCTYVVTAVDDSVQIKADYYLAEPPMCGDYIKFGAATYKVIGRTFDRGTIILHLEHIGG